MKIIISYKPSDNTTNIYSRVIHIYTHIRVMHICTPCVCMYVCMYVCSVYTHSHSLTHMSTCRCVCVCERICKYIHQHSVEQSAASNWQVRVCVCVYVYTYIHQHQCCAKCSGLSTPARHVLTSILGLFNLYNRSLLPLY